MLIFFSTITSHCFSYSCLVICYSEIIRIFSAPPLIRMCGAPPSCGGGALAMWCTHTEETSILSVFILRAYTRPAHSPHCKCLYSV